MTNAKVATAKNQNVSNCTVNVLPNRTFVEGIVGVKGVTTNRLPNFRRYAADLCLQVQRRGLNPSKVANARDRVV